MCSGSAAAPTAVCAARCGVKVCVLQCARYGHGVQAAGRHALVRARMREERRRPLAEVGHRLVVIEADHRADVVAQELCKPHEESRIWQQVSKYKEVKRGGRDANTQTAALKRQRSKHARLNHSDYAALGLHERNITSSRVRQKSYMWRASGEVRRCCRSARFGYGRKHTHRHVVWNMCKPRPSAPCRDSRPAMSEKNCKKNP